MSLRENIILNVVTTLEGISELKEVRRNNTSLTELESASVSIFPFCSVLGNLPTLNTERFHRFAQGDKTAKTFESTLDIDIFVYGNNKDAPDTEISNLLEKLWKALYADPLRGGTARSTFVTSRPVIGRMQPIFGFVITATVTYKHSLSEI